MRSMTNSFSVCFTHFGASGAHRQSPPSFMHFQEMTSKPTGLAWPHAATWSTYWMYPFMLSFGENTQHHDHSACLLSPNPTILQRNVSVWSKVIASSASLWLVQKSRSFSTKFLWTLKSSHSLKGAVLHFQTATIVAFRLKHSQKNLANRNKRLRGRSVKKIIKSLP